MATMRSALHTYKNFSLLAKSLLLLVLFLGAVSVFLYRDRFQVDAMGDWVQTHRYMAPLLFTLVYAVLTTLFFPSTLMSLAGGILFGPLIGIILNLMGATLSAITSFSIGRYLAADWLERHLKGELKELKHGVEKQGWRFVLMLRIVPGLPFALFNYALGVTRIPLLHFAAVTAACILPRVIFLTYAGYTGRRVIADGTIGTAALLILITTGSLIAFFSVLLYFRGKPLG